MACDRTASDWARSTLWTITSSGTESFAEVKFQIPFMPAATSSDAHSCAAGVIPGVGVVTEGILTLSRVCAALEEREPLASLPQAALENRGDDNGA